MRTETRLPCLSGSVAATEPRVTETQACQHMQDRGQIHLHVKLHMFCAQSRLHGCEMAADISLYEVKAASADKQRCQDRPPCLTIACTISKSHFDVVLCH